MNRVSTLVSAKWLADKLVSGGKNFRLLDATWHLPAWNRNAKAEYDEKHISNALFFDLSGCSDKTNDLPNMLPSVAQFEEHVGKLGVNNDTHVVLYDNNDKFGIFSVQRVWWTFRVFGHKNVSILDGGLPKWCAEGQNVTKDVISVAPEGFNAQFHSELVKSYDDIQENLRAKKYLIVDSRPAGRFNGTAPEPRADVKPGHIPGSVNMPFMDMMDPDTKTVKKPEVLKKWFAECGVDLDKPLLASCGSGVAACCVILSAHLCGREDVPLYDGAWTEWFLKADPSQTVNCPKD